MSEPLRVGIVGAGRMGQLYARIVQEATGAELVALVGNTPAKTRQAGERLGVPAYAEGDFQTMWAHHPSIDVVIVATPEWAHLDPTVDALRRGAHVLLEKPMAHTLDKARQIAMAAEEASGVFMMVHSLRFDPRFALMQQAVAAGRIGEVHYMYARRNADQDAAQRILGRCHPAYWLTPHDVDVMRWVTGSEVVSATAQGTPDASQAADGIAADLRFANGALGRVENLWNSPPLNGRSRWGAFHVFGEAGNVELIPYEQGLKIFEVGGRITAPDTHEFPDLHGRVFGVFPALIHHFLRAAREEHPPLTGWREGLATMEVAEVIRRSLGEKRTVVVEEL
jgi:predicted dehydrogenase